MRELSKVSAIVDGRINVSHAKKKRKLDRHKLLTESKLEPVTTWA